MDYKRETSVSEAPLERIRNFNEFHTPLSKEEQQIQGARCMNCGVPFCQAGMNIMGMTSGCPHNYFGEEVWKPYIGSNGRLLTTEDMKIAVSVNRRAEGIMIIILIITITLVSFFI